jgi:hypothetical protein
MMTLPAFETAMLPFQEETGLFVIESRGIPAHKLEFRPMMFLVAFRTFELACVIMVALACVDSRPDLRVARKTVIPEGFFTEIMALRAVVHSFQLRMGLGKLSRRSNLRRRLNGGEQTANTHEKYPNCGHHNIQV